MRNILGAYDYEVVAVNVRGTLHLKSVATAIADDLVVVDISAIDPGIFGARHIEVPAEAANMLRVNGSVLAPAAAAPFVPQLQAEGVAVELLDNSELAKAEGALTCCSLIFRGND
jgi:dimethylargininase